MPGTRAQFAPSKEANRVTYQIVRQTAAGPVGIESDGMALLQPGDLVNIIVGASEAAEQLGSPAATTPAGEVRVGRPADRQETGRTVAKD
jgi:hypothetical protein